MKILTIIAILVVLSAALVGQVDNFGEDQSSEVDQQPQEVLSEENQGTGSASLEVENQMGAGDEIDEEVDTPTPQEQNPNQSEYIYPNSQVVSSSSTRIELTSNDNPEVITDWYKEKIESAGKNVTSFVTTNNNDNVLNELVGDDGNEEVRVEIRKNASDDAVQIFVEVIG